MGLRLVIAGISVEVLSDEHNDTEVSLGANMGRIHVHPTDTFEAFRHLVEGEGQTPEAIGVRFGCAASTARGLEFAKVSPGLMRAFREDEVTLDQMQALPAVADDHGSQQTADPPSTPSATPRRSRISTSPSVSVLGRWRRRWSSRRRMLRASFTALR
jgi:hypothetical protein